VKFLSVVGNTEKFLYEIKVQQTVLAKNESNGPGSIIHEYLGHGTHEREATEESEIRRGD
jgi:protein involved in ribonucleotide reduction